MRTKFIKAYIHERLTKEMGTNPKKSGEPSRPARGAKAGVMVAMVLDDKTYGVNLSLVNSGRHLKGGRWVRGDKFNRHVATGLAVERILMGEPVPSVVAFPSRSKRAEYITAQWSEFLEQAAKVFQDKTLDMVIPNK